VPTFPSVSYPMLIAKEDARSLHEGFKFEDIDG